MQGKAEREEFARILLGIAEIKGKEITATALELWWNTMRPWSLADFKAAANQLMRTCIFMPTPADFYRLQQAGEPTAGEAWAAVLANVRRSEYRTGRTVGGRTDRAVRAIGGYAAIGAAHERDLQFMERRFSEAYAELGDVDSTRAALPGIVNPTLSAAVRGMLESPKSQEDR